MKKSLLTLAIVLLAVAAQAQFKVHDNGHVSVGCLTRDYGLQVYPGGFSTIKLKNSSSYGWIINSSSNLSTEKQWVVTNRDTTSTLYRQQVFYVLGNGTVWARDSFTYGLGPTVLRTGSDPIDKEMALASILQLRGYYYDENNTVTPEEILGSEYIQEEAKEAMVSDLEKRSIGLDASLLKEVFPDAVRTDTEARLCINYNAVVTLLLEAMKQQQEEIEFLQKTLEENGLLEPEKR